MSPPEVPLLGDVTLTGWVVAAAGVAGLVAGSIFSWAELLVLGVAGLAAFALSLVAVRIPRGGSYTLTAGPTRTTTGGRLGARVDVRAGRLPLVSPELRIPTGPSLYRVRLPLLGAGRGHLESVEIAAVRRGVHEIGPAKRVTGDPLGICRTLTRVTGTVEVFVRPLTTPLGSLAPGMVNDLEGVPSDQLSVSDLAFHALREYVRGDDLRHVHWKSSARADRLLVRQYQETRRSSAVVLVDTFARSYADEEDLELAVSAAASVLVRALQDDFDVAFGWDDQGVASDASHPDPLLDATCRVEVQPLDNLKAAVARTATNVPGASLVVLVSGGKRRLGDLTLAISAFPPDALRIVIRADHAGRTAMSEHLGQRVITVSRLTHLGPLLAEGR
ncbi:MAG TPA: DUF58 domain-containing protein [Nocardioidaceae bacterium]|nr:DUF58 domain-containing protein [Nocardioidaceae bacterium]